MSFLVVALAVVGITVVVVILQEEVLICAVGGKSDGRNSETGEESLEAIEPREGTGVPPGLTVIRRRCTVSDREFPSDWKTIIILACPRISAGVDR